MNRSLILFLLPACNGWLRMERVCDMDVDGICVSLGNVELSGKCMSEAIDIAYHRYSLQYGVDFNTRRLAENHGLYVMWRSIDDVHDWCSPEADGCFSEETDEIMIRESCRPSDVLLGHLAHEMMHVWNAVVLRYRRPDLFAPSFDEVDGTHMVPHLFSDWCKEHEGKVCIEDVVRAEIHNGTCWMS